MKLSELPKTDAKLQMLFHHGNVNFQNDDPNVETIGPEDTLTMAQRISAEPGAWEYMLADKGFMQLLRLVFTEKQFPDFGNLPLCSHGHGLQHTVGLIVLIKSAVARGKKPFVRFPESYLHPSQQVGLGDLFVQI